MNLKKARKEKKLTQLDVAIKVGVSMMTYQLWEREAMKPSEENMDKLKEVLGL